MHAIRLAMIFMLAVSAGCSGVPFDSTPPGGAPEQTASGIAPQFAPLLAAYTGDLRRPDAPGAASTAGGLYVTDPATKSVQILANKTYSKSGAITKGLNGPDGDWIDASGNLYVANYKGHNVTEYAPGTTTPACLYSSKLRNPINVTTDISGNVFVVDWNFGGEGGVGYIDEYAQCADKVAKRYIVPGGAQGAALDSSGDLFVSYLTYGSQGLTGAVAEFAAGSSKPQLLGARFGYPGGMVIDSNGNLLVCDQTGGTVDVIDPPYSTVNGEYTGFTGPFHVGLTQNESLLFVADPATGKVTVLTYPVGILKKTLGKAQGLREPVGVSDAPNAVF